MEMRLRKESWGKIVGAVLAGVFLLSMAGCMTVSDKQTIVQRGESGKSLEGKTIAVLPVKAQTSLAPDTVMPLRREISQRLGPKLTGKLPSAKVKDMAAVVDLLNQQNGLENFEQLLSTYENTGVIDKSKTKALSGLLGSQYLLFSRLKAEKLDILISRGMGASLELMIVDAQTANIVWGGTGEWKRGGIFGAGKAPPAEAADNLVNLAFASL
jgi:hypothetical protein